MKIDWVAMKQVPGHGIDFLSDKNKVRKEVHLGMKKTKIAL